MAPAPLRGRGVPLAVALLTVLVFVPALWNDFVEWDDYVLLVDNAAYRGLGWRQLRWMATSTLLGHYVPVTWLTFGLDYVVWGMNPFGYHLTNVLLHGANAGLVFVVAARLLAQASALRAPARQMGAATAALFFALHPLRVESVAWLTERRGVLSGFFFLVTIVLYLRAADTSGRRRGWLLAGSVAAYLLALASKAIVMTTPAVLVLLDVYPLGRLRADPRAWCERAARAVWLEKVPYLLLGLTAAATSYYTQGRGSSVTVLEPYGWAGAAVYGLWFHSYKTLLPVGLSPLYELPARIDLLEARFLVSAVGVVATTIAVLSLRRVWPGGLAAWAYHGVTLAPVIAFAHAGPQLTADRYSYLAGLGWAMLVGAGAGAATRAAAEGRLRPLLARALAATAAAGLLGLTALTWRQVQVWHDSGRLWRHAVAVAPDCATCRYNLGTWLLDRGLASAALAEFEAALALRPDRLSIHGAMGVALASLGRYAEAIAHYEQVLARYPGPGTISDRINLAAALVEGGRLPEGVDQLRHALRLETPEKALARFRRAVELKPAATVPRLGLLEAYAALGRPDLAREQYRALGTLNPALARFIVDAGVFRP